MYVGDASLSMADQQTKGRGFDSHRGQAKNFRLPGVDILRERHQYKP